LQDEAKFKIISLLSTHYYEEPKMKDDIM